ncbi:MAG: phosphatase PAP2 family protein [Planctomycetota bacterium]
MTYFSPAQRRLRRSAFFRRFGLVIAAMIAATAIDRPVYWVLRRVLEIEKPDVEGEDWWEFLRAFGYLPTWVFIAGTVLLFDRLHADPRRPNRAFTRASVILLAPVLSGLAAEVLKVLFARERPDGHGGWYHFRPIFSSLFDSGGLGLPSSHTAVAFGGAWATALLFPFARPALLVGAIGCAASRVLAHAHFVSDCVLAAIVAMVIARALFEATNEGRRPNASLIDVRRRLG